MIEDKISEYDKRRYKIYYTPNHIIDLILALFPLNDNDRVIDPCCGDGRILKRIKQINPQVYCKGIDVYEKIIRYNLKDNHYGIDYEQSDFINCNIDDIFTYSIINPPYGLKEDKTELDFICKTLNNLCENGLCICIIPQSILSKNDKLTIQYKKRILEKHTLESVISLNPNAFEVGVITCLAVFRANIPHNTNSLVKFINFEDDGYYKLKKKKGVAPSKRSDMLKEHLQDVYYNPNHNVSTHFLVESQIKLTDEWLYSFYYYNDVPPMVDMFYETMENYLNFKFTVHLSKFYENSEKKLKDYNLN